MTDQEYIDLTQPYQDAERNLMTRLEILNSDFRRKHKDYPIHNLQHRIKKKDSVEEKLRRCQAADTAEQARDCLLDIAGIRVICYFVDDIHHVVTMIKKQSDLLVLKERDYIKEPKPNGYRSYHLVLGVPVYYTDTMEYFPVEVQLRTMSMDFWASMEHRICYKKNPVQKEALSKELLLYAEQLEEIEHQFEQHNDNPA